jgi:hypothetical protein
MSEFVQFRGYAPDLPPETSGIFIDCSNIIPAADGFEALGSPTDAGADALTTQARGFAIISKIDNTKRAFAATQTNIYELSGGSWTDRTQAGGYDVGSDQSGRVRFAQFGDVTLAAVGHANSLQASSSTAFANVATAAPQCKIVETVNNFVFAFNYVDNVHGLGTRENGWWCCAIGDHTDWVPDISTQCVAGSFPQTPGPIVAARRLGDSIIAYKQTSMFIGQYVGVPDAWKWQQLPGEIGAICQEAVVNVGTAHYFVSDSDFHVFDGSRAVPIGADIRHTFFNELSALYGNRITHAHDKKNGLIFWFYPSESGGGTIDKCVVYNYKLNRWGRADNTAEIAGEYIESGVTYEGLGTLYSTYDDLPSTLSYDSVYFSPSSSTVSYIDTSHKITTFTGVPVDSSITTGHYGSLDNFTTVQKVRPRFLVTPTSSTLEYSYGNTNADDMTQNITTALQNNVYDLLWSARWHKFKFNYNGPMSITGFTGDYTKDGSE